jgi:LPS sulfotransferase NodH
MRGKQQSYEAFCDQIASSSRGLVVASSQRCGTHLLGAYLHDCGIVRTGERFLPMLTAYREGALSDEAFAALLDGIKDGSPGFSICLMDYFPTVLDIFRDEGCDPMRFVTALKTLPWLWLRREHFDVAVSHYFALTSNQWEGPQDHEVPPYDFAEIKKWWLHSVTVARYWARFFAQHGISPTELWYAQICPVDLRPIVIAAGGDPSGLAMARPPGRMPHSDLKQEYAKRFERELLVSTWP